MQYSQLGTSTLYISTIGFGCMSLPSDENESLSLIDHAVDLGINFFDTADIYKDGENEKLVGKAFKTKREKAVIASKVGNVRQADGTLAWNATHEHIISSVEGSLRRLQTDHIDLYQLHGGTINDPIDDAIGAFEKLKEQGKILYYGISSIRPDVIREWIDRSAMISVMMQYSLLDRRPEESCLDLLHQNNIGVLARGSLAQGLLVDKPPASYLGHNPAAVTKASQAVGALSHAKRSKAQTALQFTLHHPAICSAVTGIRTLQQLEEAATTTDMDILTDEELHQLRDASAIGFYSDHR
jgi:aryl-alcohol dehydrogenase-like predicted oxidoreductase